MSTVTRITRPCVALEVAPSGVATLFPSTKTTLGGFCMESTGALAVVRDGMWVQAPLSKTAAKPVLGRTTLIGNRSVAVALDCPMIPAQAPPTAEP